jgi:diguanylate cyclase (GGDEF)-like protein
VLLTGADAADAAKLGERLCQAVAAMAEGPSGALLAPVTVSIGVACIVPDPRAIHQDLLGAADRALLDAKQGGRNRVVAAPLPPGLVRPRLVA